jgi:hypothetical protein
MIAPGNIYRPLTDEDWPEIRARAMTIIKWLREHGTRGTDWDFAGAGRTLSVWFNNDKLETHYILRWE